MSWPMVKLEDIFEVARGGSPRPIDEFITDDPDGINWIMIGDTKVGEKYISNTAKKIRREGLKKSREVRCGDFLLTNSMSFGRPYILRTSGCIHDGWLVLSPKSENIYSDYFYYYLGSTEIKNLLASKAAGAVVKNLNKDIVKNLEIPLPPLSEQQRIATILDKADAIRQKRQQAIKLADDFLRSVFLEMFGDPVTNPKGWKVEPVGKLVDCIVPGRDKPKSFTGETPWITTNDLDHLGITDVSKSNIGLTPQEISEVNARLIPKDSVIMTCVGDLGVVSISGNDLVMNQQLHAFLPNSEISKIYLMYSLSFQKDYMLKMASSTTVPYMNKTICNSVPICLPERKLQDQFESVYDSTRKIIGTLGLAEKNNIHLFDGLSQKAFSGQL